MKDVYNKLVRDNIPEIIVAQGDIPVTKTLNDAEYFQALNLKLQEEVAEYFAGFCIEEIADVLEVIHAIIEHKGISFDEIEQIRKNKKDERGSFYKRINLIEVKRKKWFVWT